jgi:hypothetical protein
MFIKKSHVKYLFCVKLYFYLLSELYLEPLRWLSYTGSIPTQLKKNIYQKKVAISRYFSTLTKFDLPRIASAIYLVKSNSVKSIGIYR